MDMREIMQSTGLCKGLDDNHIDALIKLLKVIEYPPNAIIIPEDNHSRDLYVIASGKVSVIANVPFEEGQVEIAESLRVGQVFGDVAFVDGYPRSATVKTQIKTTVFQITYEPLVELMNREAQFGYIFMSNIANLLASKIRNTTLALRNLML